MRLELTGRHIDITTGMRRIVDGKLARLERILNDTAVSAQVVFSREKTGCRADVTLHARGEKFLHAVGKAATWQAAIGQATDKMAQQAQKVKGKWEARKRRPARVAPTAVEPRPTAARPVAVATGRGGGARLPSVLAASRQRVKPLSVSDASRQLGANGRLLVFRNADTMELSVLYRGSAGELILVETDA